MTAGFSPDAPIRLRDTRRPGSALLVTTVLCLGLAIGGAGGMLAEILMHPACVASLER